MGFHRDKSCQIYLKIIITLGFHPNHAVFVLRHHGPRVKINGSGQYLAVLMVGMIAADLRSAGGGEAKLRFLTGENRPVRCFQFIPVHMLTCMD